MKESSPPSSPSSSSSSGSSSDASSSPERPNRNLHGSQAGHLDNCPASRLQEDSHQKQKQPQGKPKKQAAQVNKTVAQWKETVAKQDFVIKRALTELRQTQLEKKQQGDTLSIELEKIKQQCQQLQSRNAVVEEELSDLEIRFEIAQAEAEDSKAALALLEKSAAKAQKELDLQRSANKQKEEDIKKNRGEKKILEDRLATELENTKKMFETFKESSERIQKETRQKVRASEKKIQTCQCETLTRERNEFKVKSKTLESRLASVEQELEHVRKAKQEKEKIESGSVSGSGSGDDTRQLREQVRTLTMIKELLEAKNKCLVQTLAIDARMPDTDVRSRASSTSPYVETLKLDMLEYHPKRNHAEMTAEAVETDSRKRRTLEKRKERHQRNISEVPTENGLKNAARRLNNAPTISSSIKQPINLTSEGEHHWEDVQPNGCDSGDTTESENIDDNQSDDFEMVEVEIQGVIGGTVSNPPLLDAEQVVCSAPAVVETKSDGAPTRKNTPPVEENVDHARRETSIPVHIPVYFEFPISLHIKDTTTQSPEQKKISDLLLKILKYPLRPTTDAFAKEWEPYFCTSSKFSNYTIESIMNLIENGKWTQNDKGAPLAQNTDTNPDGQEETVKYIEVLCGPEGPIVYYPKFTEPDLEMEARIALLAIVANANWRHGAFLASLMKRIAWRCCQWSDLPNNAEIVSRLLRVYTLICRSLDDLIPTRVLCNDIMTSIQRLPIQEQEKYKNSAMQAMKNAPRLWPKIADRT